MQSPQLEHAQILAQLRGGLVVSCQAPEGSPLRDRQVIAAMAQAAMQQGAVGVRLDTPDHIQATRVALPDAPIIGLWKQVYPESEVYITPQFHHAEAIAHAGADIIALDCTLRSRPGAETFPEIIQRIHADLGTLVMADIDTLEAAIAAAEAGADVVGTTLFGYTGATQQQTPPSFDLVKNLVEQLQVPVICEGGIASPTMATQAFQLGAYSVVVGTAITGIDQLVKQYVQTIKR
ncbi:MAG: N-acetylmannosamine-6-phosphate 2-epimerase [Cyanobacteria bacterium P01_H01_bin.121]